MTSPPLDMNAPATARADRRVGALLCLFYLWVVLRNAWLCEDSFISFRVVDNFLHGLGLRWNPLERVQVYTHPLWLLCVSAVTFATRDVYSAAMGLGVACSVAAVALVVFRTGATTYDRVVVVAVLAFSKAFVDYSTSGLENPLSHLLVALFLVEYLRARPRLGWMVLWAGLGLTDRMDLVWCFLPPLVHVAWKARALRPRRWRAWLGLAPFVAWEGFALLYYGFLFPNSAYAKLGVHIPARDMMNQGGAYLLNSLSWDPLTLFAIGVALLAACAGWRRDRKLVSVAAAIALHLAYLVRVGGDYMSGRFLSVPLLEAAVILSRVRLVRPLDLAAALGVALALGVAGRRVPLMTSDAYGGLGKSPQGVDDEMGWRFDDTALLRLNREHSLADRGGWIADGIKARRDGARVVVYRNVGYFGFFAGPRVHVLDPYGIGDPLIARMPFDPSMGPWEAGHYLRAVPDGYPQAALDEGRLADDALEAYWRKLELVTRGRLLDPARLRLVARFNLGLEPPPAAAR